MSLEEKYHKDQINQNKIKELIHKQAEKSKIKIQT